MAVRKLRIDGRTIRSDETYTGNQVMHLLDVSFENGRRRGRIDCNSCTGCKSYDTEQTATVCKNCKRYYRGKYEEI